MDDDARVFIRVFSSLGSDRVLLIDHRFSYINVAVLEDCHGVAEYEVHRAIYVAIAIELSLRVDIEGVLIPLEAALVENGEVGARTEGYGLVFMGSGRVLECHASCYEPFTGNACTHTYINMHLFFFPNIYMHVVFEN